METTTQAPAATGCAVSIARVSKAFGDIPVLADVSLDIAPGEIVSIVGRSGVGKSTLLRLVAGLMPADSGIVTIGSNAAGSNAAGSKSAHVDADEARMQKKIGFVPQAPALLPWRTVAANVSLPSEVNRRGNRHAMSVDDALRAVGLAGREQSYPAELSGGMQHRVALARALHTGAPLLLFDEPFAALDEVTRVSLYELIGSLWRERCPTMLFVTHNIAEAALLSDRVFVLSGTPARTVGSVYIDLERPRVHAMDEGQLREPIEQLRTWLREVES